MKELRREPAGTGIDTTVSPATTSETTGTAKAEATRSQSLSVESSTPSPSLSSRVSSAEYLVSGIKQHKLAARIGVVVVLAAGGFFGYRYFKSTKAERIGSIAVLPFENRSGSSDAEYLSDGLADSLIYRLSQLPNLKVSPTSSVMRYKGKETDVAQIAQELKVDAVMSGRLVQRGDDLNISVQLIDARTQKLIWDEQ